MVGYNSAFQAHPRPWRWLGEFLTERAGLGQFPCHCLPRGEGARTKVGTNTFTSGRMGEEKLIMDSCLIRRPRSPGTQLLLTFAEIWLGWERDWAFVRRGAEN